MCRVSESMNRAPYKQYTPEAKRDAVAAVKNGMSCSQASRDYGVPDTTLRRALESSPPNETAHGNILHAL